MAQLNFKQEGELYVAEFNVAGNFNLHIEREKEGRLDIYQKTSGEKYVYINEIGWLGKALTYDNDFKAEVYPKTIKIVSATPITTAIVTSGSNITVL